ncbi:MAG: PilZ domain-containing protein [Myxococcales bacterium]|nr:PilZ domain-containing protein [Myxococcales bacterium]
MTHVILLSVRTRGLVAACRAADVEPVFAAEASSAYAAIAELGPDRVQGLVVDASFPDAGELGAKVRDDGRFYSLPIVALVDAPQARAFLRALAIGADDAVVRDDLDGLSQRLGLFSGCDLTSRPRASRGRALVAHADLALRRAYGRAVRWAGFDPVFAATREEVETYVREPRLRLDLLVMDGEQLGEPGAILASVDARVPTILTADVGHERDVRAAAGWRPLTAVTREQTPTDEVLFLINELLNASAAEGRRSRRLLASTLCSFRPAGIRSATWGLTYNFSREGLYVRTMAALPEGIDVWVELRPDEASPWIHLRGKVVWRRRVGVTGPAVPAGFGIELQREACPAHDLALWDAAYERQLACEEASERPSDELPEGLDLDEPTAPI